MIQKELFSWNRFEWSLFLFIFISIVFFIGFFPGWNELSRLDLVFSIVDQGQLNIDSYWNQPGYATQDLAYYNGHYYCDKSPILSFLAVPFYWLWRQLGDIFGIYFIPVKSRLLITPFLITLPAAILSVWFYRFLGYIRTDPVNQYVLTMFYSLGTIAFPFSYLFFSHVPATFFIFGGFFILFLMLSKTSSESASKKPIYLLIAGLMTGLGFSAEQPTGIILAGILGYLYYRLRDKKRIFWFLLGVLPPLIIVMWYNYTCFGNIFASGYRYEYNPVFQSNMSKGFMGITYPKWQAFWGTSFSPYRGLFFYSPFLLFAIPGFYRFIGDKKFKAEGILFLLIVVGFFYFNISYYAWHGGWSIGPRHIIPMLPFLVIPIYTLLPEWKKWVWGLGILSVFIMSLCCFAGSLFPEEAKNPLISFVYPHLKEGLFSQNILIYLRIWRPYTALIWLIFVVTGTSILYQKAKSIRVTSVDG